MSRAGRLTDDEYSELVAKLKARGRPIPDGITVGTAPVIPLKHPLSPAPLLSGRIKPITDADGMNKTERAFFQRLCAEPDVRRVIFQGMKFKLGNHCWYEPDFYLERMDWRREIWEVKGHWEDDARVKIKTAAGLFPGFAWYAVTGQVKKTVATCWDVETIFSPTGTVRPIVIFERRDDLAPAEKEIPPHVALFQRREDPTRQADGR